MKHVKVIQKDRLYTDIDGKPMPVDKSQVLPLLSELYYRSGWNKEKFDAALKQGIDIDPSLIEVHDQSYPEWGTFSFLKQQATISSVTNCPTCGSRVRVEGDVTHYYVPFEQAKEETNEAWIDNFTKWCCENIGNAERMKDVVQYNMWLEQNYQNPKRK